MNHIKLYTIWFSRSPPIENFERMSVNKSNWINFTSFASILILWRIKCQTIYSANSYLKTYQMYGKSYSLCNLSVIKSESLSVVDDTCVILLIQGIYIFLPEITWDQLGFDWNIKEGRTHIYVGCCILPLINKKETIPYLTAYLKYKITYTFW